MQTADWASARLLGGVRGATATSVLFLAVSAGYGALGAAQAGSPVGAPVQGIDVSHYSGAVDWRAVEQAGYAFAYVKATEGVDNPDPSFSGHWSRLAESGLARGAYHFYVTEDDPEEQARFFLSVADPKPGDLAPAVDVETLGHGTRPDLPDRVRRFLDFVEQAVGIRPLVYTSPKFWDAHMSGDFGGHPLWIAEYGTDSPSLPAGWERWTLWQHVDSPDLPGVEKDADVSRLHPDVALDHLRIPDP